MVGEFFISGFVVGGLRDIFLVVDEVDEGSIS